MTTLRAFEVQVAGVQQLSPTYRRITFAGPTLARFAPAGPLGSRDLRVKLMLPADGGRGRPSSALRDGALTDGWYQHWLGLAPEARGVMRTYTVRRIHDDGGQRQLDIDFALHIDADGRSGPASAWAQAAQVGDSLTILGPGALEGYGGITWNPPDAAKGRGGSVLLAGDETAVPAICSVLESLPAGFRGHAVLEVPHPEDFCEVATAADVQVTWLARAGRPHGKALVRHVGALLPQRPGECLDAPPVPAEALDAEEILWDVPEPSAAPSAAPLAYTWVAGETALVRELRRTVAGAAPRTAPRRQTAFMGYWRRGRAEGT